MPLQFLVVLEVPKTFRRKEHVACIRHRIYKADHDGDKEKRPVDTVQWDVCHHMIRHFFSDKQIFGELSVIGLSSAGQCQKHDCIADTPETKGNPNGRLNIDQLKKS